MTTSWSKCQTILIKLDADEREYYFLSNSSLKISEMESWRPMTRNNRFATFSEKSAICVLK